LIEFSKISSILKNSLFLSRSLLKTFGLVLILVISLVINVYSQEGAKGAGGGVQGRKTILDFKQELKLTEDQVKSIKKIIDEFETKNRPLLEKLIALDKELKELLEKEGDLGEIKKRIKEIYNLRAEMIFNEIEAGRKIDKVLNKEQKEKWKQIRSSGIKRQGG
jgi:Spy/CpxP family protein refolding chaperone